MTRWLVIGGQVVQPNGPRADVERVMPLPRWVNRLQGARHRADEGAVEQTPTRPPPSRDGAAPQEQHG